MNTKFFLVATVGLVAFIIGLAGFLGTRWTPRTAFLATLGVYWVCCWVLILLVRPDSPASVPPHPQVDRPDWLIWIPVIAVCGIAMFKSPVVPSARAMGLLAAMSLVNGITEECFWRRTFAKLFSDPARGVVVPCILFTLWHVALLMIPNIRYEGGGVALVGGAGMMGCVWAWSYWVRRSLVRVCAAHVATNIFAFFILATDNGWINA